MNRKDFIKKTVVLGMAGSFAQQSSGQSESRPPTPSETEGPFYPVQGQKDKDFDLTQWDGREGKASGDTIFIDGLVLNEKSEPIENAVIDLWQANAFGRYRHPHDNSRGKLDPNFQGWAVVPSGVKGQFRFKTVFPGSYLVEKGWERPPHIHFKVTKPGYVDLVTQMYFPGHLLNEKDFLLQRKGEAEGALMVAQLKQEKPRVYQYTIVLKRA